MIIRKEETRWSLPLRILFCVGACQWIFAQTLAAEVIEKTSLIRGTTVRYKLVLPNGYDSAKVYPAVLALGGGAQTMNTVDAVLNRYFRAEAEKRGYII